MAHCFIMDFETGTAEGYDAVLVDMGLAGRLPEHALYHGAGAHGSGWRVVDVWETPEAFQAFADAKIGPISSRHGFAPPRVTAFPVEQIRRRPEEPVTFMQVVRLAGVADAEAFAALDVAVLGPEREAPEGCIFHVNGPLDGGWCVVDYWSSKAIRDRFIETQVMPAMPEGATPPVIEDLALHNALTQPALAHA